MKVDVLDDHYLAITALVTVGYQFMFFCVAAFFKFDKVTDFAGGTNFVVLAILTFFLSNTYFTRQIVLSVCVWLWGLRLSLFLLTRILMWGEDNRFDDKRQNIAKFAVFWIFQTLWVWIVSLPVTIVNSQTFNPPLGTLDYVSWSLFAIGLVIEAISDIQKLLYVKKMGEKRKWCLSGLWKYSRHPNYFGEILLWWAIFIGAIPVLRGWEFFCVISPIFISCVLLFLSGIPLLETSMQKRFSTDPEFKKYIKCTSPLLLFPRFLYKRIPLLIKRIFFFEFPMYAKIPTAERLERVYTDTNLSNTQMNPSQTTQTVIPDMPHHQQSGVFMNAHDPEAAMSEDTIRNLEEEELANE